MARSVIERKVEPRRTRATRLGFRVDAETKKMVQRAAALERRSLTDFCLTALTRASREAIERGESLVLSQRDRSAFFEALMSPPPMNERLRKAFSAAEERITS